MFELTSMLSTVLLLPIPSKQPICECATIRKLKQPMASLDKSNLWVAFNPDLRRNEGNASQSNSNTSISEEDPNVMATSFDVGITVLAIAEAVTDQEKFPQLDPKLAYYHTSAWRWIIRQLSLYPDLVYEKVFEFRKVWRRRFHYEDVFVPQWLKKILVWVDHTTWDTEHEMIQLYNINAKREFDKNDRYPPKNFVSHETFGNSSSIFYPGPFEDTP